MEIMRLSSFQIVMQQQDLNQLQKNFPKHNWRFDIL